MTGWWLLRPRSVAGLEPVTAYNVLGRQVRVLVEGVQRPGSYQLVWDSRDQGGTGAASGLYFCRLEAGAFTAEQKVLLLR